MEKTRRQHIIDRVDTVFMKFFYYDRKEDEVLGIDGIEEAITAGEITCEEIKALFMKGLDDNLPS